MSLWESLSYLHKMPGPHNVAIRGNWIGIGIWRLFADATIYVILFISLSGIYLWWAIKAERLNRCSRCSLQAHSRSLGLVYAWSFVNTLRILESQVPLLPRSVFPVLSVAVFADRADAEPSETGSAICTIATKRNMTPTSRRPRERPALRRRSM